MMKKFVTLIAMFCLIALSATALTVSSPTIGDDRQDRVQNVTATFTITNNQNNTIENITITSTADAKYAISFTNIPTSIAAGSSGTVTVKGNIPLDHDAVDNNLNTAALNIGALTVKVDEINGSKGTTQTANINMQAVNQLEVKVRARCGDRSKRLDNGDRFDKLHPGMDCDLEIEAENLFSSNDRNNLKIGDIEMRSLSIDARSSDNDIDIDVVDNDLDGLGADEKDTAKVDAIIEDDARDGTTNIEVEVIGTDENGARHAQLLKVKFEVDRETHDIQIKNIDLSPSTVSACQDSNVRVSTRILNQGKRNEDDAAVEVKVDQLQFSDKVTGIEIDEDDSTAITIDILVPKGTEEGIYRTDVHTFFDTLAASQSSNTDFTVTACETDEEEPTTVIVDTTPTQASESTTVVASGGAKAAPVKSGFGNSTAYVAILIVLIVLILAVIASVSFTFLRKRK